MYGPDWCSLKHRRGWTHEPATWQSGVWIASRVVEKDVSANFFIAKTKTNNLTRATTWKTFGKMGDILSTTSTLLTSVCPKRSSKRSVDVCLND